MSDTLKKLLEQFIAAVPSVLGALVLLIAGLIIASIIARIIKKVLVKIKIDRLGDKLNEIDFIEKMNAKILISSIISKFVYYILVLVFIIGASDLIGMTVVSEQIGKLISYMPKLLSGLILFFIGLLVSNLIKNVIYSTCKSLNIPSANIISGFVFYLLLITFGMSALAQAEVNMEFFRSNITIVLAGVVLAFAIGYGIASRDVMSNMLAAIYSKNKFAIGETIRIKEVKGEIIAIDGTSVTIKTEKDTEVIIPLSHLQKEQVEKF